MKTKKFTLMLLTLLLLMAAGAQQVLASAPQPGVQPKAPTATVAVTADQQVIPVVASTPLPDGTVKHIVQPGQAAWTIASIYGITVAELAQLNNLDATNPSIFPNQELLIKKVATATAAVTQPPTQPAVTNTPFVPPTATVDTAVIAAQVTVPAATEKSEGEKIKSDPQRVVGYGLVVLCLAGLVALFLNAFKRA